MMKLVLVFLAFAVLLNQCLVNGKMNFTHEANRTVIPHGCPRGEGVVYHPFFECKKPAFKCGLARQYFNIPGCGCGCKEANCTVTSFHQKNTTTCPKGFVCLTDGCLGGARKANLTVTCSGICKPLIK